MIKELKEDLNNKIELAIQALHGELKKIRTNRAHPSLLESVQVDYYGSGAPLQQVASINASDARTLMVTPWEKNLVQAIEKAIIASGLGLNPISLGNTIKIPMPALTEERRKQLIKIVKNSGESAKISIRNSRRDVNADLKLLVKKKTITEDEERTTLEEVQKITDSATSKIDVIIKDKEQELLEL